MIIPCSKMASTVPRLPCTRVTMVVAGRVAIALAGILIESHIWFYRKSKPVLKSHRSLCLTDSKNPWVFFRKVLTKKVVTMDEEQRVNELKTAFRAFSIFGEPLGTKSLRTSQMTCIWAQPYDPGPLCDGHLDPLPQPLILSSSWPPRPSLSRRR